jgi:hypothetical protein
VVALGLAADGHALFVLVDDPLDHRLPEPPLNSVWDVGGVRRAWSDDACQPQPAGS